MDHDATREQLELAALEPGGIDRLMAGDTATAQAVAAHLAGCPACSDELTRLTRASRLIAAVIAEAPPADLRERTLAGIRALGRPRGLESSAGTPLAAGVGVGAGSLLASPTSFPTTEPTATGTAATSRSGRRRVPGWVAAIAAAIVLSVATTTIVVGWRVDQRLAEQADTIGVLEEVTTATLRVTAEAGARHVVLTSTSDPMLDGSLVFSPSTAELVVIATGLTAPPAGQEFRCWLERAGTRTSVGRMFFSGDIAYWIGPVPAVSGVSSDATFGVSLVDASGAPIGSSPILVGGL